MSRSACVELLSRRNVVAAGVSEPQFAALVDALAADTADASELIDLLHEDHPIYDQRGTADGRSHAWLDPARARPRRLARQRAALRSRGAGHRARPAIWSRQPPAPSARIPPARGVRAVRHARARQHALSGRRCRVRRYGEYAMSSTGRRLFASCSPHWSGWGRMRATRAAGLEALRAPRQGSRRSSSPDRPRRGGDWSRPHNAVRADDCCDVAERSRHVLRGRSVARQAATPSNPRPSRITTARPITYGEFFRGQPSIVVFFYTRCDNPQKCSLTVSKLARVQQQLAERGLADQVRTAAITYDPGFDLPERLRALRPEAAACAWTMDIACCARLTASSAAPLISDSA